MSLAETLNAAIGDDDDELTSSKAWQVRRVKQALLTRSGSIDCPPLSRLEGFARCL